MFFGLFVFLNPTTPGKRTNEKLPYILYIHKVVCFIFQDLKFVVLSLYSCVPLWICRLEKCVVWMFFTSGTKKAHKGNLHKGFLKSKIQKLQIFKNSFMYMPFPQKTHIEGIHIKELKLQKLTKKTKFKKSKFSKFRKFLYVYVPFLGPYY